MLTWYYTNCRSKFLTATNALSLGHSPSPSGTSSPVQILPSPTSATSISAPILAPTGIPASKIAFLKDGSPSPSDSTSASTTAPPITISGASIPSIAEKGPSLGMGSRTSSVNGWVNGDGSKAAMGGLIAGGRDPRGKARSRDYLKQLVLFQILDHIFFDVPFFRLLTFHFVYFPN